MLVSAQHADGRHLVVVVVVLTDVSGEFNADVVVLTDESFGERWWKFTTKAYFDFSGRKY